MNTKFQEKWNPVPCFGIVIHPELRPEVKDYFVGFGNGTSGDKNASVRETYLYGHHLSGGTEFGCGIGITGRDIRQWAAPVAANSRDSLLDIAVDGSRNSCITGPFTGTATFGAATLTNNGGYDVFVAKPGDTGMSNDVNENPHDIHHSSPANLQFSCAPNPPTGSAVISYRVPERGDVLLEDFDRRGRKFATLVANAQNAGVKNIGADMTGAAVGTYFARLQTDGASRTIALKVVK
jgi:hypothetical protein